MKDHLIKPIALAALILFALATFLFYGNKGIKPVSEMRILMDTIITIKVYQEPKIAKISIDKGFAAFSEVEQITSFHLKGSGLSELNLTGKVSPDPVLASIIFLTNDLHEKTLGYFDPTFARLQKAYGFYDEVGRLPGGTELKDLLTHTGWKANVKTDSGEIYLASGSLIDLGGIAGGYAIELAAKEMRAQGCRAFLIDDAGDIWFEGKKPDNSPWRISVRDPRDNSSLAIFESFESVAISTSGNYERFVTVNGKNYGHIMDPLTGMPADYYQSVTVIASSPVEADVFSTAIYAMPPEMGLKWAEENSIPALCLTTDNQIRISRAGERWFRLLKK